MNIWESLLESEKVSWWETASRTQNDWIVWCKSKKRGGLDSLFRNQLEKKFSIDDETKSDAKKKEKEGSRET